MRGLIPKFLETRLVSWDPSPRNWLKINFDGFLQEDKMDVVFVVRNYIGELVGMGSIPIVCILVSDPEIQELWEALVGQWRKFLDAVLCWMMILCVFQLYLCALLVLLIIYYLTHLPAG